MLNSETRGREDGSVILAMLVVMVVTFSMFAALGSVGSGLNLARNDQNRTNAFQWANAGIDHVIYRLDNQLLPVTATGGYTPTLDASGRVISFRDTIADGSSQYSVTAEQSPVGQDAVWRVRAVGKDASGRERQAVATVTARLLFENGFFTDRTFYLTGEQTSPVAYSSSACPTAATSCELATPIPSRLGTNATIEGSTATTASFVSDWQGFNMYGRATQAAADQACDSGRCGTAPKVAQITNRYEIEVPSFATTPCPSGGNIGASAQTTHILPGDYSCPNLTLNGTIVVAPGGNGTGKVRFLVSETVTVGSGAVVNRHQPPAKFQIFQKQDPGGGSVCGAEIWALLYTPGLEIDCVGNHQPKIYGAVVAELHSGTGNHFDFHWDIDTRYAVHNGKYVLKDWRECPVGTTC